MKKSEIAKIFNKRNRDFGIQNFKTDYILRQTGIGTDSAIIEKNDVFYIDKTFLEGLDDDDRQGLIDAIARQYSQIQVIRKKLYDEINAALILSDNDKIAFISHMLTTRETEKKGQCFEVSAFAILKTYYSVRGFELNRFSTIYSNDGGIDYTSQTSIYQVTTMLSEKKFDEDIVKAPLKKRIFVYKKLAPGFNMQKFNNELVSDYISSDDLLQHMDYLCKKSATKNLSLILKEILKEFEREHYL